MLTRQATGSYATSALRTFDAWGQIRVGAQTGDPKGRYCASLGHKQDDESRLVYMRARYYEPTSGRFISEDPIHDGLNWFAYAKDSPTNGTDFTGKWTQGEYIGDMLVALGMILMVVAAQKGNLVGDTSDAIKLIWTTFKNNYAWQKAGSLAGSTLLGKPEIGMVSLIMNALQLTIQTISETEGAAQAFGGIAARAALALGGFAIMCIGVWLYAESQ
jgi:RHS repeat-associated protein